MRRLVISPVNLHHEEVAAILVGEREADVRLVVYRRHHGLRCNRVEVEPEPTTDTAREPCVHLVWSNVIQLKCVGFGGMFHDYNALGSEVCCMNIMR